MRILIFLSLLPFFSFAQLEVHSVFEFRDLQVKTFQVAGKGAVKYFYQDGRIISQSTMDGEYIETHYYYGAYDQIDSVQIKRKGKAIATTVYDYNSYGQLASTRSGTDPTQQQVVIDSFFYNPTGQLLSRKSYSNQLGPGYGYRRAKEMLLREEVTYTYNDQGQQLAALSTGWVLPSELFHTYDTNGRIVGSQQVFNTKENQEEAGDRLVVHYDYTYGDHGLVTKIVVTKKAIRPGGREIFLPGRQRFKHRYTFYGEAF